MGILSFFTGADLDAHAANYRARELEAKVASLETQLETKSADQQAIIRDILGTADDSGEEPITIERALLCSTVLACARVIAEGLAQVPCKVLRPSANGGKEEAVDHPLFRLLHRRPNEWQTSFEFREQIGLHLALTHNAFVLVIRDGQGRPKELWAYEPGQVTVTRKGYELTYTIRAQGKSVVIPNANMWHIRGPSLDGHLGMDAVQLAREAIGLSLATQKFGRNLFRNGARPSGLLSTEQALTGDQIALLKASWEASQSGVNNAHKTAVLANGMRYERVSVSPDEAQFLQTRKLQIEELCRVFRVLPLMVMHNEGSVSYNSIEQQMLAHVTHTLAPWFERFEQSAEVALLTEAEQDAGYQVKLNTRALMKGSAQERATYYSTMRQNGLMTINECRDAEDMNRIDDPLADKITPAANLFGQTAPTPANNTGDNTSGEANDE